MNREEATSLVGHYLSPTVVGDIVYSAVRKDALQKILPSEAVARLLKDPIRRLGPDKDSVYPWNVVDYLVYPDLNKKLEPQKTGDASSPSPVNGQLYHEAYCKAANGVSSLTGKNLPGWTALPADIQDVWEAAATAIGNETDVGPLLRSLTDNRWDA